MFCFETGVCNVLQTFWKVPSITCFSGLKNSHQVGDFQVATGGGFWVATRGQKVLESAGILNTPTGSQTVVNIINKQENIIPPIIEELARKHFGGLILDKSTHETDEEETAKF